MRERLRAYPDKPTCTSGHTFGSVRWQDCSSSVIILGCGVTMSVVLFIMEAISRSMLTNRIREKIMQLNCSKISEIATDEAE